MQFYFQASLIEGENVKQVCKRTQEIQDRLNDIVSSLQELKIELGNASQRSIRQWTTDLKAEYTPLSDKRARLCIMCKVLNDKQKYESLQAEDEIVRRKMEKEEILRRQIQQQEKEQWEERMRAQAAMTEKKIQMEKEAKISKTLKLPALKISPFNGEPLRTGYSSKICLNHKSTANLF